MSEQTDLFAERLLQVIDEGRRTATYKLALILALIDASAAECDDHGRAPPTLHTRAIAHHVLRLYLPQARVYLGAGRDPLQLRQITMKSSAVLGAVLRLHMAAENHRLRDLDQIARLLPEDYERCVDEVEVTFARYPLRLLQVVGKDPKPFLYDLDWEASISLAALHREGAGMIRIRPGAGDHLLRLAPLLRPLIEVHWTRMVARINHIDTEQELLHAHLFGASRTSFPRRLRSGLSELQDGRCFYCDAPLGSRTQVDHFIPWSRSPNNAIENLVLADACNSYKHDYLPSIDHVRHWARRLRTSQTTIAELADLARWESARERSVATARACFAHLPEGTPLWRSRNDFVDDQPSLIVGLLTDLP